MVAYYTLKNQKNMDYQPDPTQELLNINQMENLFLVKKTLIIIISHYDIL